MPDDIVCKFGGSSVANASQIIKVEKIVRSDPGRKFIVVSAPGKDTASGQKYKVTDLLYNLYFKNTFGSCAKIRYERIDELSRKEVFSTIQSIFYGIAKDLGIPMDLPDTFSSELDSMMGDGMMTPDDYASRGENFNARLIAKYLDAKFIDSATLIRISGSPDGDNPDTMRRMKELRNRKPTVVVPGFYGLSAYNERIKTFQRGGSDLTGSLVAAGVGAELYENWTDQPGIRCCDPNMFPEEEKSSIPIIRKMSYKEARELTYMGFEVFNDKAIGPVKKRNIPINVRNTNEPESEGTLISSEYDTDNPVRGIAGRKGFCSINVEKYLMNDEEGFGRRLLEIISRPYEHSPSGIDNVSVVLDQGLIHGSEKRLLAKIREQLKPDAVDIDKNYALIAIVGVGMKYKVGMAAKITECLARNRVNIEIMNQGPSQSNIIIGVKEKDYQTAIRGLYKGLFK